MITAPQNRKNKAKVLKPCTVYNEPKRPEEIVQVDDATLRNMERKGLLKRQ
jgi:hypothetical protein